MIFTWAVRSTPTTSHHHLEVIFQSLSSSQTWYQSGLDNLRQLHSQFFKLQLCNVLIATVSQNWAQDCSLFDSKSTFLSSAFFEEIHILLLTYKQAEVGMYSSSRMHGFRIKLHPCRYSGRRGVSWPESPGCLMISISLLLLFGFYPTTESLPIPESDESLESPKNTSSMIVRVVVTSSSSSSTSSEDFSQIHDFSLPVFSTTSTNRPKETSTEARDYYNSSTTTTTTVPTTVKVTSTNIPPVHKSEEVEDIFSAFYRAFSHSNSNSHRRHNSLAHKRGFPPLISSRSLPPTPRRVDGGVTNEQANTPEESEKVVSVVSSSKSSVVSIQKTPRPKVSLPSLYSIRRRNGFRRPSGLTTTTTPSWQETEKVWGEPAKVWSLPAQVWSEPERVWSQPEKVWTPPSSPTPPKQKSWKQVTQKQLELLSDYPNDEATSQQEAQEPSQEDEGVTAGPFVVLGEDENEQDSIDGEIDGHLVLPATLSSSSISKISSSNYNNENVSNSKINSQQQPHLPGKSNLKFGYVLEGSNVRRYRVEERTPDGFIVGEYGVLNNQNAFLRGVRYTADGTINPRLIHEALMKFLSLRRRR